jgi:hypothetical protein
MRTSRFLPALALAAFALALTGCGGDNVMDLVGGGGVCGLLILIADIYAFVQIANSTESTGAKLLWGALVFFFPVGGLLLWYFFGPKSAA